MNMITFDGRGSRRSTARGRRGPLAVRALAAAGASTLLLVAGCTSTGTEVPRTTQASDSGATVADSGVTAAGVPYAGADPSSTGPADQPGQAGQTDEPAVATESGSGVPVAAPATTVVPAPGGDGNIQQTVPTSAAASNPPVALDATGDVGNGVTVSLGSIESVTAEAQMAGEVAGPGVRFQVTIVNGSTEPIDLSDVIVDLADANGTPAIQMTAGASPLGGSLDAGATASGIYIFATPDSYTNPATISVGYSAAAPVAVFSGDAK